MSLLPRLDVRRLQRRLPVRAGPRSSERSRRQWRTVAGLIGGLGLLIAALGLLAPRVGADTRPRPVLPGADVELPAAGFFGGVVAVYGRPTTDRPPTMADLGCTASTGTVTQQGVDSLDRLVVGDVAVVPVLRLVRGPSDGGRGRLLCSGPASRAIQPVYVVARPGAEDMVPMASFSVASLFCTLGGAGLLLLRPEAR
jgi:hypothetical protein